MNTRDSSATWAVRAQQASEWVFWVFTMNVLWLVFTLLGAVVLGAAPATVAAAELTRRHARGESFPTVRGFAMVWRREFIRANALLAPLAVTALLLLTNAVRFANTGQLASPLGILTIVALAVVAVIGSLTVTMYVHYDLPLRSYALTAARFTARNLAHALLLAAVMTLILGVSLAVPGLIPFFSVGAWMTATTVLCLAFFASNDRRLAEAESTTIQTSRKSLTNSKH